MDREQIARAIYDGLRLNCYVAGWEHEPDHVRWKFLRAAEAVLAMLPVLDAGSQGKSLPPNAPPLQSLRQRLAAKREHVPVTWVHEERTG